MPYGEFTIETVQSKLGLSIVDAPGLCDGYPPMPISALLAETLAYNVPLALAISSEKARSEMIVSPILVEVRRRAERPVSLFSGLDFNVDPARRLNGLFAFMLSLSPLQLIIEAPAVVLVEAKKDDINAGLGQCIAEMEAARVFNERYGRAGFTVFGVVTTGSIWRFLALDNLTVRHNPNEYYLSDPARIVGILVGMLRAAPEPVAAS
jgi:hypothetical protein